MELKRDYYARLASQMLPALQKRRMDAFFCPDPASACKRILDLMPPGSSIGWGGSHTLEELGVMDAIRTGYTLFDRDAASAGEKGRVYAAIQTADFFLTGANAVTQDGILVNVDGRSDRVSFLCHGPRRVIVAVGMNKVVPTVGAGLDRVWQTAGPMNAAANGRATPCALTGVCTHCFADECVCSNIVITRRSSVKGRIKVVLVGEALGF